MYKYHAFVLQYSACTLSQQRPPSPGSGSPVDWSLLDLGLSTVDWSLLDLGPSTVDWSLLEAPLVSELKELA
ncbi:hypothetical protein EYF80_064985 [Liparis tanakae]|uniref:Uncharacterized protein n=1 Tax=Liparis tanakae TaxID=230148 RepID=A0A4Z2E7X9_9TELE|nr:hypothetical protein EYF80_064985 [Liparis tanakae]